MNHSVYKRNLDQLKKYYPEIADRVIDCNSRNYVIEPAENGSHPNLVYESTDDSIPPIVFYDSRNPKESIKEILAKSKVEEARFVVILGVGLGYPLSEMLASQKLKKLVIVEKDPACLKKAMEVCDLSDIIKNPDVKLVVGCSEEQLFTSLHNILVPHAFGLKEMRLLAWPASICISKSYYSRVVEILSDVTNIWMAERGNDPYDTLVGYEHFLLNIRHYMENPGAGYVKDLFKGRPAVVVATGPSLKKNIHLLKEVEASAVILSADSSMRILHQYDILPHFVTTVERTPGFDKQFIDLDNLDKTVFAAVTYVHPSTLDAYKGPYLFFNRIYNFMENLGVIDDCIDMGLSTANMAFNVARHMGCDPIILVGNDLAFDSSGNSHSKGFLYGEKQECYKDDDHIEIPGNYERTVKTNLDWYKCIKQYERSIDKWEGRLINATAGGARIEGSEVLDLKEVIQLYCHSPFYPRDIIMNHLSQWQCSRTIDSVLSPLEHYIESVEPVIDVCRKMSRILSPLLREIEESGEDLPKRLQADIEQSIPPIELAMNSLTASPFVSSFGEYFHTEIIPTLMEWQVINDRFESPLWASAYRIKLAETFFSTIGQLCFSLKPVLQDGQKILSEMKG